MFFAGPSKTGPEDADGSAVAQRCEKPVLAQTSEDAANTVSDQGVRVRVAREV